MRLKEQEKVRLGWVDGVGWGAEKVTHPRIKKDAKLEDRVLSYSSYSSVWAGVRSLPRGRSTPWHCLVSDLDCAQHWLCPHGQTTYIPSPVFPSVK